nr:hypothetical protein [Tanacetum cinerariifolium]
MLPKGNQTILDAPIGYVGLYTHFFTLSNLRIPLPKFFCEVVNYFKVHISRFNPFGIAKLTTFVVMCKAYGGEPTVDLLRAFLNLGPAGNWLTLSNRDDLNVPRAITKPITHIKGEKGVDGKFHFLPEGSIGNEEGDSPSMVSVNNKTPVTFAKPFIAVAPS